MTIHWIFTLEIIDGWTICPFRWWANSLRWKIRIQLPEWRWLLAKWLWSISLWATASIPEFLEIRICHGTNATHASTNPREIGLGQNRENEEKQKENEKICRFADISSSNRISQTKSHGLVAKRRRAHPPDIGKLFQKGIRVAQVKLRYAMPRRQNPVVYY